MYIVSMIYFGQGLTALITFVNLFLYNFEPSLDCEIFFSINIISLRIYNLYSNYSKLELQITTKVDNC